MKTTTRAIFAVVGLAALLVATSTSAAVPVTIGVQGQLLNQAGGPVADGAYGLKFSLYSGKDAKPALWSELIMAKLQGGRFDYVLPCGPVASKLCAAARPDCSNSATCPATDNVSRPRPSYGRPYTNTGKPTEPRPPVATKAAPRQPSSRRPPRSSWPAASTAQALPVSVAPRAATT